MAHPPHVDNVWNGIDSVLARFGVIPTDQFGHALHAMPHSSHAILTDAINKWLEVHPGALHAGVHNVNVVHGGDVLNFDFLRHTGAQDGIGRILENTLAHTHGAQHQAAQQAIDSFGALCQRTSGFGGEIIARVR